MKKFLGALLGLSLLAGCAGAEMKVGFLLKLNIAEEKFRDVIVGARKSYGWHLLSPEHNKGDEQFVFFDSLVDMGMALDRGDIDEASLPQVVAEYILNVLPGEVRVSSVSQVTPRAIAFGFAENDKGAALRDQFNEALAGMKADGTLKKLQDEYLINPGLKEPQPVEMETFEGAERLRILVTGDLPPIDYISDDGLPIGFNTAVCAEIGRRLHRNVELANTNSAARSASLASGRVDAVFWFLTSPDSSNRDDAPEGVLLSTPYYEWEKFFYLAKAKK